MDESKSDAPCMRSVEEWARRKDLNAFTFAGAKCLRGWGQGRELSEADFDAAVSEFLAIELR